MKTDHTLTGARLRALTEYRNGHLYWRNPTSRQTAGPIGWPSGHRGRLQVEIGGTARYVHRLIWLYHHDEWPAAQIDHMNGDMHDNRIENMRVVGNGENAQNRRVRGVTFERRKQARPWRARIMVDKRSVSLGYFDTEAEALAEYQRAKLLYHPPFATGIAAA